MDEKMYLVVTIDTEEDGWGDYSGPDFSTRNIERIPLLQELFDRYGVKPAYLLTYPVATNKKSISILKKISESGRCEIGVHPHPWNTPPFEEEKGEINSVLCNLSPELQFEKIRTLRDEIKNNFDVNPVTFRTGRWGYDENVARNIVRLGFKVDTSITPYIDWSDAFGPDFSHESPRAARVKIEDVNYLSGNGYLLEIPATIGFLQRNDGLSRMIYGMVTGTPLRYFGIMRLLSKLNLLNKICMTPELATGKQMSALAESFLKKNYRIINMFFHSPSLVRGMTPFVVTEEDEKEFLDRVELFLKFATENGIKPVMPSEALNLLK